MHLDVRSWYSFHDGVASPAELCAHAAELGFEELGIADIDGTYGLIQFYKAAIKNGVKPILGIALTDGEGGRSQDSGFRGRDSGSRIQDPEGMGSGDRRVAERISGGGGTPPEMGSARVARADDVGAEAGLCPDPQAGAGDAGVAPTEHATGRMPAPPADAAAADARETRALPPHSGLGTRDSALGTRHSALRTSDFGQDAASPAPAGPGAALPGEPAAWVFARDRDGYGELCWLAAWRQGCLADSEQDAGFRIQGSAGVLVAQAALPAHSDGRRDARPTPHSALAHVLATHTDHCFVVCEREGLLNYLAPRLGPGRLFVRLDPNYGEPYRARQIRQLKLAARYGLSPVALSDVRFLRPQDQVVHHVLRAIGQNATLYTAQGVRPRQHYLSAPTELPGMYYDCPAALTNTRRLAARCEVDFELGRWVFPDFPLRGGADPRVVLHQLCERGLSWRGIGGAGMGGAGGGGAGGGGAGGGGAGGSPADSAGRLAACPTNYAARLEMELRVIEQLGYTSYFLAVYDIVREAKRRRIPHVGRGSAANSLVSYLLGLTPVDPLRYDMYFERFLNPQRTSPPDIDIDFNWKRRDEILNYVYQRWGQSRVAMISTHVSYRGRSAIREVAKVFGLGDAEISAVSKFLPHIAASGLPTAQRDFPELRGVDFTSEPYCHVLPLASRLDGKPRHLGIHCGGVVIAPTRMTDYTGLSLAAKGFVVTQYDMFPIEDVGLIKIDLLGNRSLGVLEDTLASIAGATPASPVGAAEMRPSGSAAVTAARNEGLGTRDEGLGKKGGFRSQDSGFRGSGDRRVAERISGGGGTPVAQAALPAHHDGRRDAAPTASSHLALRTSHSGLPDLGLRTSDSAAKMAALPGHGTTPADIHKVISDWETISTDEATVALIRDGLTMGCFYIESPGMRQLLRRLRTRTFLDLTAASSVIRPGVAESGMMQEYIRRVRGESAKMPTHPLMREVMPETHGVMIYQEDVIKVAHRLAGMSLADADLLRRAMSGKLRSQSAMNQIRERFIGGCEQHGLDIASALEVWRQIASFASYSFCKAHSASFATLSFQVAYLKAHYPAQFMAAVLSNGGGFYGPRAYLSECERLGLRVLPPDVNFSQLEYTAEQTGMREQGTGNREGCRMQDSGFRGSGDRRVAERISGGGGTPPDGVGAALLDGPRVAQGRDPYPDTGGPPAPPDARETRALPPDSGLRTSDFEHAGVAPALSGNAIRVGLALIKGVGAALLARIVAERERRGMFRALPDFIRRTRPGERDLEILIKCGALDSLGLSRPELLWLAQIERKAMVGQASRLPASSTGKMPVPPGDAPLPFDDAERIADFRARVGSTLDDYDELKLCELELTHLGLFVRRHPLTLFQHYSAGIVCARDLPRHIGRWVRMLGWCIATKRVDLTHRQAVRDTLELQAEHSDRPEPSPTDERDELDDEREGTAEDLGIVLREPARQNPVLRAAVPADLKGVQAQRLAPPDLSRRAMKFMSMEDLSGTFEVTLFADAYARFAPLTRYSGPFLVTGKVEEQFDTYTINATGLQLLRLDEDGPMAPPGGYRDGATRSAGRANKRGK